MWAVWVLAGWALVGPFAGWYMGQERGRMEK